MTIVTYLPPLDAHDDVRCPPPKDDEMIARASFKSAKSAQSNVKEEVPKCEEEDVVESREVVQASRACAAAAAAAAPKPTRTMEACAIDESSPLMVSKQTHDLAMNAVLMHCQHLIREKNVQKERMADLQTKYVRLQREMDLEYEQNSFQDQQLCKMERKLAQAEGDMKGLLFDQLPRLCPRLFYEVGPIVNDIAEAKYTIGPYRLEKKLGEGYYGKVWLGRLSEATRSRALIHSDTPLLGEETKMQRLSRCGHKLISPLKSLSKKHGSRFGFLETQDKNHSATTTTTTTTTTFAIKVLDKSRFKNIHDLQQLNLETKVLRRHSYHENIIGFKEVIHAPDNIYFVMEAATTDIHSLHYKVHLNEASVRQVMIGILRGVQNLHSKGIAHLDLKPENVLVVLSQERSQRDKKQGLVVTARDVRICDFGLVAEAPRKNLGIYRSGYTCGTPGLFAPEMVLKGCFEGRSADMWSIGCILLELTVGYPSNWLRAYSWYNRDADRFRDGIYQCMREVQGSDYFRNFNSSSDSPRATSNERLRELALERLLVLEKPEERSTASQALNHPWLNNNNCGNRFANFNRNNRRTRRFFS